jgi:capsular polysaccharide biosynthesis protein
VNVSVAQAADTPAIPAQSPLVVVVLGFFVALAVGVGAAFVAEYMDGSFRTPDEVREFLDLPVIASVPKDGEAPIFIPGRKSVVDRPNVTPSITYDA